MAMAAWDIAAAEFLQGANRQKLALPKHSVRQTDRLLWGALARGSPFKFSNKNVRLQSRFPERINAVVSGNASTSLSEEQSKVQQPPGKVVHLYRVPLLQDSATAELLKLVQMKISNKIIDLKTEQCFNIGLTSDLSSEKHSVLKWVLGETYEPEKLGTESFLNRDRMQNSNAVIVEVGPRLSFTTAWSANAVSICKACGLTEISRMERSRRYLFYVEPGNGPLSDSEINEFAAMVHDRMTECVYSEKLSSFETSVVPEKVWSIPVLEKGRKALEEINEEMGFAFDEQDLQYYTKLFRDDIKRNPTNVELFDIAQSNSEHSRHWFFTGKLVIDGQPVSRTLMQIVLKALLVANPNNSVIGFKDNSLLKTHNFPCAVAPYPGAETGAGGRIRDTHATGRGSFVVASTAGYCVGNLNIEGSYAPWEDPSFQYPANLASPLQILIDSSNGASDYGNKFGEPLIQGYTRTFGMRLPSGERREWLKPIMFSAGIGQIDHIHITKGEPEIGMLVVKIGGPAYRIGMGGGAASSMVSGQNDANLDFNAVQRGDAEMAQKLYRVVRACVEMGKDNPIISIHDQGAGGNCNVVKEIIHPQGAQIDIRAVVVGDHTMSVLEIWGAEYQEQDAILIKPESGSLLQAICKRERLSMAVIGTINGEGRITLVDSLAIEQCRSNGLPPPPPAVDLELEKVLGDMPQKTFESHRANNVLKPLDIAPGTTVMEALNRQQTVGPLQITLSDVAVIAQTYTDFTGGACSIGEQPIKGLGNWMYAAKLDGEGAAMYDAAIALSESMIELGIAIDGGKDSLSMAARASGEVVKAPGNLVIRKKGAFGGSALAQAFYQIGDECPDLEDVSYLKTVFNEVQNLLSDDLISAGHDISDGGLLVGILEMAFAGNCGICLDLTSPESSILHTLFAEELGVIIEVNKNNLDVVMSKLQNGGVSAEVIGKVTASPQVDLRIDGIAYLNEKTSVLRDIWEETSFKLEKFQRLASCVELEKQGLKSRHEPLWKLSFTPNFTDQKYMTATSKPKVAVIREEGSNGDREMSAAFYAAGFEPWDVAMSDLLNGVVSLHEFRGIVFVGGFSYADVLDSAKGWAASIRFNQPLLNQFQEFYNRPDTFSLGVCNGCQLMALLGWVPGPQVGGVLGKGGDPSQPRYVHNESGRFECRFTSVTIQESPSIMFKGMEGSTLGVWAAHVKYCDDDGTPTEVYPFNLNGSPLGVAAICSPDGRHLAMMPHPERCFLMWQFPWYPKHWDVEKKGPSPWLRVEFAYESSKNGPSHAQYAIWFSILSISSMRLATCKLWLLHSGCPPGGAATVLRRCSLQTPCGQPQKWFAAWS
nr:probable phosphoribosylformylglycinamidine synthase, chloroplastic/mitochondrial [Ipomoea batatas]